MQTQRVNKNISITNKGLDTCSNIQASEYLCVIPYLLHCCPQGFHCRMLEGNIWSKHRKEEMYHPEIYINPHTLPLAVFCR